MSKLLEAALAYASDGYFLLPLHDVVQGICSCSKADCSSPGKHPRLRQGFLDASNEAVTIIGWWEKWPNANIGIRTGYGAKRILVVDIDGDDASAALAALLSEDERNTASVKTGKGKHLWYAMADGFAYGNKTGYPLPHVDIRAEGGYIVAPPSRHASGSEYTWTTPGGAGNEHIKEMPEALLKILTAPKNDEKKNIGVKPSSGPIASGQRNDTLFRLGCSWRAKSMDDEEISARLYHENLQRCSPPLDSTEMKTVLRQVLSYDKGAAKEEIVQYPELLDVAEFIRAERPEPSWALKPLLPQTGLVLLSGDTGSGKTSLCISLAVALSHALPFAEAFEVPKPLKVLYLNAEMDEATLHQYALANMRGFNLTGIERGQFMLFGDGGYTAMRFSPGNVEARKHLESVIKENRFKVVFLDTFRALFDIDENNANEVRAVLRWLKTVSTELQCLFVVPHHLRKMSLTSNDARERVSGSRDLIAGVDVHLAVISRSGHVMHELKLDKTRALSPHVRPGTVWSIAATISGGEAPVSSFVAQIPEASKRTSQLDAERKRIRQKLVASGFATRDELGANGGSAKRALDEMRDCGELIRTGKSGRADIWKLAEEGQQHGQKPYVDQNHAITQH